MRFSIYPILGVHVGFEFTDALMDNQPVSYLLIDLFIIRIQCAWYPE